MGKLNKLCLGFLFFLFVPTLTNASVSLDKYVDTINYGELTSNFAAMYASSYNFISITSNKIDENTFSISYTIMKDKDNLEKENYNGTFYVTKKDDMFYSETILSTREAEKRANKFVSEIYRLIPLWAIEASNRYDDEIKELFTTDNKLLELQGIFDRCYFSEMGLCSTSEITYSQTKYIAKVELSEKSADYVISTLKEHNRELKNDKTMAKLFQIFIILLLLYLICYLAKKSLPAKK